MTPIPPVAPPTASGWQDLDATDPTRVFGRRALAWVLDLALFWAVVIGVYASTAEYVEVGSTTDACVLLEEANPDEVQSCLDLRDLGIPELEDRVYVVSAAAGATQTLTVFGYFGAFTVLQGILGASPGKLLVGLRVVREDGRRAGVGRSLARTLAWVVDGAPWFVPLVGAIVGLTSTGHRRIGDMIAGTYVVGRADVGRPVGPRSADPPPHQGAWGAPSPPQERASTNATSPHEPIVTPGPARARRPADATLPPPPPQPATWAPRPPSPPPEAEGWGPEAGPPPDLEPPTGPADHGAGAEAHEPVDIGAPIVEPDPDWYRAPGPDVDDPDTEGGGTDEPPTFDQGVPHLDLQVDTSLSDAWVPPESAFDDSPVDRVATDEEVAPPAGTLPHGDDIAGPTTPDLGGAVVHDLPPPQWDPRRNTYLQWDPNERRWLAWDTAEERWVPIT